MDANTGASGSTTSTPALKLSGGNRSGAAARGVPGRSNSCPGGWYHHTTMHSNDSTVRRNNHEGGREFTTAQDQGLYEPYLVHIVEDDCVCVQVHHFAEMGQVPKVQLRET